MNALEGREFEFGVISWWEAVMKGRQVGWSAWLRGTQRQRLVCSRSGFACAAQRPTGGASRGYAASAGTRVCELRLQSAGRHEHERRLCRTRRICT